MMHIVFATLATEAESDDAIDESEAIEVLRPGRQAAGNHAAHHSPVVGPCAAKASESGVMARTA